MSKRISPKRYIYENGNLIIKYNENESTQVDVNKNIEYFIEEDSKKNKYPGFSPKNIIHNNYKIFSTELDGDILNDIKKNDSKKNKSFNNGYESYDNNKEEKKEDNDYNNEYTNYKSIEINPSNIRKNPRLLKKMNHSKISSDIERMCKYLYTSPRKNENNIKFKMFEKESEYVKELTKKNYLVDEDLINKQTYRNKIKRRKNNQSQEILDTHGGHLRVAVVVSHAEGDVKQALLELEFPAVLDPVGILLLVKGEIFLVIFPDQVPHPGKASIEMGGKDGNHTVALMVTDRIQKPPMVRDDVLIP